MRILHAAAECFPLAKTGGLGDVVYALPAAQRELGFDAQVAIPGYRGTHQAVGPVEETARFEVRGYRFRALRGAIPKRPGHPALPVTLLDAPELFDRPGDLYRDAAGQEFGDNALRFGCFSEAVAKLAQSEGWPADILHLHDWQSALAAAWLRARPPQIVYTIHNLAYQGQYSRQIFDALGLPASLWSPDFLEFWGEMSFMKGGISLADALTTVSPTYAHEIQTPEFGCGLDGVLRHRASAMEGILNGVDITTWDPQSDPFIVQGYDVDSVASGKARNRSDIRAELGLPDEDVPLIVWLGRMVEQKGADLILAAQDMLAAMPLQIVILGTGDAHLEQAFLRFAENLGGGRAATRIAYDERLAHRLTAGADILLMPSRYEPCGLNQMYAQRYGTLPVVRRTGGLADTVVDASPATLADGSASGVLFRDADVGGLVWGIRRALELHADPVVRASLQRAGMTHDFSWGGSARRYLTIYQRLLADYRITGTG